MKIIENITKHELAGGLKETGDPLDPYGISETEARKWDEPRDRIEYSRRRSSY